MNNIMNQEQLSVITGSSTEQVVGTVAGAASGAAAGGAGVFAANLLAAGVAAEMVPGFGTAVGTMMIVGAGVGFAISTWL